MTAGLPRSCQGATASTPFFVSTSSCSATLHVPPTRLGGFSMMDGSVRGSYDIYYAKSGRQCHGACGSSRVGGSCCR
jgi:hypothetical protein